MNLRAAVGMSMWPTPTVASATGGQIFRGGDRSGELLLAGAVKMWPPHKASSAGPDFAKLERSDTGLSLQTAVAMFQTPDTNNHRNGQHMRKDNNLAEGGRHGGSLHHFVSMFPAPTANEDACGRSTGNMQAMLGNHPDVKGDGSNGSLNADWTEWLMGWPVGWTSLEPLPMEAFNDWMHQTQAGTWWQHEPTGVPRVATGIKNRVSRLKAIGNGQVPAVAALAWRILK